MQFIAILWTCLSLVKASESDHEEDVRSLHEPTIVGGSNEAEDISENIGQFYTESFPSSGDNPGPFRRPSLDFSSTSLPSINLRNDAKWIELENNGALNSFLSVELKASLDAPALLDISDMDLAGNIFEIYEHDNSFDVLGSTSSGKTNISSTGESEDTGIKVRWSNGRIMLPPGQHQLRIKVVETAKGGKIGIRLSPAEVINAPVKYKDGKVKIQKTSAVKTDDWTPSVSSQQTRNLKLFMIKSKLPANSIERACRLFGGTPARLAVRDISVVTLYLLNEAGLSSGDRVFIGDYNNSVSERDNSAFLLQIGKRQVIISRTPVAAEGEVYSMEYVLCRADQPTIDVLVSPDSKIGEGRCFTKSAKSKRPVNVGRHHSFSRTSFGTRRKAAESDSSSTSSDSDNVLKRGKEKKPIVSEK